MSAAVQGAPAEAGREQNNNSDSTTSNTAGASDEARKQQQVAKQAAGRQKQHSCSANTSGSSQTGDDDDEQGRVQLSNAEYEHVRNKTLLFFLDRLYLASQEGKEARTLHDLSCLFGTREFTREMRHIVGASRNGLKKFLQSYPSLFQIEGDKVQLTQLRDGAAAGQRDYNQEAVEYFKQKLLQFGSSLVPIKNLFGYRSQASQEVRHVSGKNSHDFKRFLRQNESVFEILTDEHVVLKSALRELESQGLSSLSLQQSLQPLPQEEATTMDPYLNKQLAHLIEDYIRQMVAEQRPPVAPDQFRVTLERLHARVHQQCQNELFLKMVRSVEDLRVFLRMHPKLFKRLPARPDAGPASGEVAAAPETAATCYVSLLSESERRDLEAQAYQAANLIQRQHSTLGSLQAGVGKPSAGEPEAAAKSGPEQPASLPAEVLKPQAAPTDKPSSPSEPIKSDIRPPPANTQTAPSSSSTTDQDRLPRQPATRLQTSGEAQPNNQQASHRLRANAPPFIPSKSHTPAGPTRQPQPVLRQNSLLTQASGPPPPPPQAGAQAGNRQRPPGAPIQRSASNLNSGHCQDIQAVGKRQADFPPYDRRTAIRSYLTKGGSGINMNWGQQQQQAMRAPTLAHQPHNSKQRPGWSSAADSVEAAGVVSQDDLRARTVDIVREASNIITKIMTTTDAVAFDCKGYNLGFDGKITLIQFGFLPTKQVDPMQLASSMNKRYASGAPAPRDCAAACEQARPPKPEVCVFDLITNPELAYCLKPLLESDKVVKIVHDVRNKSNALHVQFNIILNNVFDTQVANLVIQQQVTGKPAYKSRYISMGKLCEVYGGEELAKYRAAIKTRTTGRGHSLSLASKDANFWRTRPLTRPMILEATMDVYCLVGGVYQNLKARIKPEYEPLFDLLNLEGVLARIKPEEIRSAKKERKIDMEVIDLKRKLYSDTMGPVVLSNREIRLLRHIDLTEGVRQKIQQCKKVAKKLERLDSKAALLRQQQEADGQPGSLNSQSSSLTSNGSGSQGPDGKAAASEQEQLQARLDEFNAAVMMMDSSMFDELNDRLNESTSLLESLENDDEEEAQLSSGHHSHNGSSINDCCRCQCHHGSLAQTTNSPGGPGAPKEPAKPTEASARDAAQQQESTNGGADASPARKDPDPESPAAPADDSSKLSDPKPGDTKTSQDDPEEADADGDSEDSKSSACDMAVQCDLLS